MDAAPNSAEQAEPTGTPRRAAHSNHGNSAAWTAILVVLLHTLLPAAAADVVWIPADRDATLIEDPNGAFANGSGPALFAGRTNQPTGSVRRGLLRFDVATALPPRAIVESVTLRVTALPGNPAATSLRLYRVLADWSEGASYSSGGRGVPSESGDVTWIHRFHATEFWEYAGGQFVGSASAELVVNGPGELVVADSPKLLADVRMWNAAPSRNFGWIVVGDETRPQSVQSLAARENPEVGTVPLLEVVYRVPGERPGPSWPRDPDRDRPGRRAVGTEALGRNEPIEE
jgi:hypothetical protein